MNSMTFDTPRASGTRGWRRGLMLVTLSAGAWTASTLGSQAQASDVYWSIGVHQPGVSVGVSNAPPPRPVIVHPRPVVIHQPAPVVIHQPRPHVYGGPPVVVVPQPVYYSGWGYGPRAYAPYGPYYGKPRHHHHHRHGRGDRDWDDDDRGDRRNGHR